MEKFKAIMYGWPENIVIAVKDGNLLFYFSRGMEWLMLNNVKLKVISSF